MDPKLNNLLIYLIVGVLNVCAIAVGAGLASGTLPGFRPGEGFAPAGPALTALLAVVVPTLSTWMAANRPRLGSEGLAADVSALKARGYHRKDMTVVPKAGAVSEAAP